MALCHLLNGSLPPRGKERQKSQIDESDKLFIAVHILEKEALIDKSSQGRARREHPEFLHQVQSIGAQRQNPRAFSLRYQVHCNNVQILAVHIAQCRRGVYLEHPQSLPSHLHQRLVFAVEMKG
jgi:hypothetical protein